MEKEEEEDKDRGNRRRPKEKRRRRIQVGEQLETLIESQRERKEGRISGVGRQIG